MKKLVNLTLIVVALYWSYKGYKKIRQDIDNDSCQSHTNPSFSCPIKSGSYF